MAKYASVLFATLPVPTSASRDGNLSDCGQNLSLKPSKISPPISNYKCLHLHPSSYLYQITICLEQIHIIQHYHDDHYHDDDDGHLGTVLLLPSVHVIEVSSSRRLRPGAGNSLIHFC